MDIKSKFRLYAIFQSLSLIALSLLFAAFACLVYQHQSGSASLEDVAFWRHAIKETLTFQSAERLYIFASIFAYSTIVLWVITWIAGFLIVKIEGRNLFDSLFIMFVFIPIVSNLFAFIAQLSLKTSDYTSEKIDKQELKESIKRDLAEIDAENNK